MIVAATEPAPPAVSPGVGRRLMAMIYDGLLGLGLNMVFTLAVVLALGNEVAAGSLWFPASLLGVLLLLFGWSWTHGGQTLGMRAWRLRLERSDGTPLDWPAALKHYAASWLVLLPGLLGLWWAWIDRDKRTLQERIADTRTRLIPKG